MHSFGQRRPNAEPAASVAERNGSQRRPVSGGRGGGRFSFRCESSDMGFLFSRQVRPASWVEQLPDREERDPDPLRAVLYFMR